MLLQAATTDRQKVTLSPERLVDKLLDNSITDDEISTVTKQTNFNQQYFANQYFNYFTKQMMIKCEESELILNRIKQRVPFFIHNYINFCIRYSYINDFGSKYSLNQSFLDVFEWLIKYNTITLNDLAQELEKTDSINYFYCNKIINRFPKLEEIIPNKVKKIKEVENTIHELFHDPEICRPTAWASVKVGDCANPRITKFGGARPYLPSEGEVQCHDCHALCCMICQIYVPSTPQWFQDRFPPNNRDILIAAYYCNSCFMNLETRVFTANQLDSIVYAPDIVYDNSYTFNLPRIVTGWTNGKMVPRTSTPAYSNFVHKYFDDNGDHVILGEYLSYFNYKNGPPTDNQTYLGGYADFVQDDETPDDSFLVMNLEESTSSPAMFGDGGSAQIFMRNTHGDILGESYGTWASC